MILAIAKLILLIVGLAVIVCVVTVAVYLIRCLIEWRRRRR